ncbi:hypothetical protein CW751_07230 [Brumimicrobium salinarum]|uniref:histidine kinase n=1 Tax=Brumimicrobium salinarum TaxID=2058658 RepID=A0A2I0R2Z4_9FLAO|nr:ATP-binding protein [Brumimicrobium salinarum]PKR80951.1 hypothetical protein CW751_07230 [Brumimicrobium salinarum]
MIDYLHIEKDGQSFYSSLPIEYSLPKQPANRFSQVLCPIAKCKMRHGYFVIDGYQIYIISYQENVTNKILNHYLNSIVHLIPLLTSSRQNMEEKLNKNFRRLKHNIVTHSTNIHQELEKSFPLSNNSKGARNQISEIKETLKNDLDQSAKSILKLIKSSNLLRFEFDIYDLLSSPTPYLEFDNHEIHKIILFNLSPYWFDLIQKKTIINVNDCYEKVNIDPKSISVVLSLLFENATKYIANNSELCVKFEKTPDYLTIKIEMTSLKIKPYNVDKIINDGVSGEYAEKLGLSGDGLGLSIANKLVKYNKGELLIEPNINESENIQQMGIPYERNRFVLNLKKSA